MTNEEIMRSLAERKLIRKIANGLNLTTQAVYAWNRVPAERVVEVERITGIPREELRPDLFKGSKRPVATGGSAQVVKP